MSAFVPNRRQESRVRTEIPVRFRIMKMRGAKIVPLPGSICCRASDVSRSGARLVIITQDAFTVGPLAELTFDFPGFFNTHKLAGAIRWVRREAGSPGCTLGVEFTHTPARSLRSWIKYLGAKYGPAAVRPCMPA